MTKLANLTPHPINIIDGPTLPACEDPPRLAEHVEDAESINGIPVVTKTLTTCELPPPADGVWYVVPLAIAQAASGSRADLLVPDSLVRDEAGRVIGCERLAKPTGMLVERDALDVPYECGGFSGTVLDMVGVLMEEHREKLANRELIEQFERVFGSYIWHDGRIGAPGWPTLMRYDADSATEVLYGFGDGHGRTSKGDAEVCEALEAAGAVE